jgi:hypothetical protein
MTMTKGIEAKHFLEAAEERGKAAFKQGVFDMMRGWISSSKSGLSGGTLNKGNFGFLRG